MKPLAEQWEPFLFFLWLFLSWRPLELPPAHDVHVEVEDGLAPLHAVVDHHAIAIFQALILGDLAGDNQQVAKKLEK